MTDRPLLHAEQQMLMARPWMVADEGSVWEVTALQGNTTWDRTVCMAVREPTAIKPVPACWFMAGFTTGDAISRMIHPDSVITARPLLLVHRDKPERAYEAREQHWIGAAEANR